MSDLFRFCRECGKEEVSAVYVYIKNVECKEHDKFPNDSFNRFLLRCPINSEMSRKLAKYVIKEPVRLLQLDSENT